MIEDNEAVGGVRRQLLAGRRLLQRAALSGEALKARAGWAYGAREVRPHRAIDGGDVVQEEVEGVLGRGRQLMKLSDATAATGGGTARIR